MIIERALCIKVLFYFCLRRNLKMENAEVIRERDALKKKYGPNQGLEIRLDNNFIVDEIRQFVKWDDSNGAIVWVERADEISAQRDKPFKLSVCGYEQIQELTANLNPEAFEAAAAELGFNANEIKRIKGSIILTGEDFADSVSDQVKGRAHDRTL